MSLSPAASGASTVYTPSAERSDVDTSASFRTANGSTSRSASIATPSSLTCGNSRFSRTPPPPPPLPLSEESYIPRKLPPPPPERRMSVTPIAPLCSPDDSLSSREGSESDSGSVVPHSCATVRHSGTFFRLSTSKSPESILEEFFQAHNYEATKDAIEQRRFGNYFCEKSVSFQVTYETPKKGGQNSRGSLSHNGRASQRVRGRSQLEELGENLDLKGSIGAFTAADLNRVADEIEETFRKQRCPKQDPDVPLSVALQHDLCVAVYDGVKFHIETVILDLVRSKINPMNKVKILLASGGFRIAMERELVREMTRANLLALCGNEKQRDYVRLKFKSLDALTPKEKERVRIFETPGSGPDDVTFLRDLFTDRPIANAQHFLAHLTDFERFAALAAENLKGQISGDSEENEPWLVHEEELAALLAQSPRAELKSQIIDNKIKAIRSEVCRRIFDTEAQMDYVVFKNRRNPTQVERDFIARFEQRAALESMDAELVALLSADSQVAHQKLAQLLFGDNTLAPAMLMEYVEARLEKRLPQVVAQDMYRTFLDTIFSPKGMCLIIRDAENKNTLNGAFTETCIQRAAAKTVEGLISIKTEAPKQALIDLEKAELEGFIAAWNASKKGRPALLHRVSQLPVAHVVSLLNAFKIKGHSFGDAGLIRWFVKGGEKREAALNVLAALPQESVERLLEHSDFDKGSKAFTKGIFKTHILKWLSDKDHTKNAAAIAFIHLLSEGGKTILMQAASSDIQRELLARQFAAQIEKPDGRFEIKVPEDNVQDHGSRGLRRQRPLLGLFSKITSHHTGDH